MKFKAVLSLLEQTGKDFSTWVDTEAQEIDVEGILLSSRKWSSGEKLLVDLALSLFSPSHAVNLNQVFNTLDTENTQQVIRILQEYCN